MSLFKRIFPEWLETQHVLLGVHTAVGFGFLGIATALFLNGATERAAIRAFVGVGALALGFYLYGGD